MTPTKLKELYQKNNPGGHFFDRETMKFFDDRMRDFKVRPTTVIIKNCKGDKIECWELYRNRPNSLDNIKSWFFCAKTFSIVH